MKRSECEEKGLLKRQQPSIAMADASIERARERLGRAKKLLHANFEEESLTLVYSAMFHAGRALLFKDGWKERSHYCLWVYVKETYGNLLSPGIVMEWDALRQERHEIFYQVSSTPPSKNTVKELIKVADTLIGETAVLLKES